jgi:NADH-quinone oxidoreductase subunit L
MFIAAGVGAYQGAMFHLFTHAFFKALLFLGAGSVIHAMHHEQDMRAMGGLRKYLPITFAVMVIGTIAITGLGAFGFGFAGYYSKDFILESAYRGGVANPVAMFAFFTGIFVAGLTSYYSWRLIFMTFEGKATWANAAHGQDAHGHDDHASHAQVETHGEPDTGGHGDDHGHGHGELKPHESPLVMMIPLLVLSVGAVFAGGVFSHLFIGEGQAEFWRGAVFNAPANHVMEETPLPFLVTWSPLAVSIIGLLIAAIVYLWNAGLGAKIAARKGPLWTFLYNKWFFDELYDIVFVKGAKALGDLFWKVGDQKLIDGLGPNGAAWASLFSAKRLARIQSGFVYHYAFVMLLGVAGLLSWVVFKFHG